MKMMKRIDWVKGVLSLLTLAFCACTNTTNTQSLLSAKKDTSDTLKQVLTDTPFAYDVALDTISYNSCVGAGLNANDRIHGLKIGANEGFVESTGSGAVKAGLKLRSDFLQYIAKNVTPTYPNTVVTPSQIQYVLKESDLNKELRIQFAVRTAADLQVVPDVIQPGSGSGLFVGRDGVYENALMDEDPVLTSITKGVTFAAGGTVLSEGPRTYNLGPSTTADPIEASFGYSSISDETFPVDPLVDDGMGAGEDYSDRVRLKFNSGTYILTQTFGDPNKNSDGSFGLNSPKRKLDTDVKKAFGKSFELSFKTDNAGIPSHRKNILDRVTEKNLEDGKLVSGASWSCESVLIMKTNQWNNRKINEPSCTELNAADLEIPATAAKVKKLRRHYPENLWGIGYFYDKDAPLVTSAAARASKPLCIVNKNADCYLPTTGIVTTDLSYDVGVQYDKTKECYLSRYRNMGVTYIGNPTPDTARKLGRCPQYASICIRSSTSF